MKDRRSAYFDGSRLYGQARAAAEAVFAQLQHPHFGSRETLREFVGDKSFELSQGDDSDSVLRRMHSFVDSAAARVSRYHGVPALAEAVTLAYYGGDSYPNQAGMGLKLALSALWQAKEATRATSAHAELSRLVHRATLAMTLEHLLTALKLCDGGKVNISPDGIAINDRLLAFNDELAAAYGERGRGLRLADETARGLFVRPFDALVGIERILAGERPNNVEQLSGTVFSRISANASPKFWAGIWARLKLLVAAGVSRDQVSDDPNGIAIIGKVGFNTVRRVRDPQALQGALYDTFWTRPWARSWPRELRATLVVERPALPISTVQNLIVTSPGIIADSLSWFVETSLIPTPGAAGIELGKQQFKELLSQPFEEEVARELRAYEFEAGPVTENGTWMPQGRRVDLAGLIGEAPPGEIDVLGIHKRSGVVLLLECKVLARPMLPSRLRNLMSKLGPQDTESFWAKLRKKRLWLLKAGPKLTPSWSDAVGIIVLDRPTPGMGAKGERLLLDIKRLRELLRHLDGQLGLRPIPR